ncbi:low temperature requirement protein A [Dysgonomonas mossii]|uniref:Low temperature requirement protein A n=1 Tax=Dysgonomonas mossii TaxID=163665 RepID=A0A4Y9IUC9_9BACT|nr:low temperature requirement protein A [Dysgonomonas mossii]MBF0760475.1 low temperature requirement protein A [Dysgonomonas mossii]TFU91409.1 low temperature requirement protein A [Dysgonomonas mossii]
MSFSQSLLRSRGNGIASVSFSELLFDLIYVFAVTQISHYLLHHLTWLGFLQSAVIWFAMWMAWQHTTWMTNWFDPNTRKIRIFLFILMLIGLIIAAAIPDAFGDRGLIFALCYIVTQIGRSGIILFMLGKKHHLTKNYARILIWFFISAVFWIVGALEEDFIRLILWTIAVLSDYIAPMHGFYLPILGRSDSSKEWTIEGHHLTERCQLFVIIAFGETILMTGASLSELEVWTLPVVAAALLSAVSSLAMWWVYFDTSSEVGAEKIQKVDDPGMLGLKYHAVHVVLVGALIMSAVGDELTVNHPLGYISLAAIFVIIVGPVIYLVSNIAYKWLTCHIIAKSHIVGIIALLLIIPFSPYLNLLIINALSVFVFVAISIYEMMNPYVE